MLSVGRERDFWSILGEEEGTAVGQLEEMDGGKEEGKWELP